MKRVFIADGARIVGSVKIGSNSSVWFNAVIRGDDNKIEIGDYSNVQDNAVIHARKEEPTKIGDYVSIGHGAVVHCSRIGNNVLIGMNSTIMEGVEIKDNVIVAAGAVVTPKKTPLLENAVVIGAPAIVRREINEDDIKFIKNNAKHYAELARKFMEGEYE